MTELVITVDENYKTRFIRIDLPDQTAEEAVRNVERTLNRDQTFVSIADSTVNSMKVSSVMPAEKLAESEPQTE
jgi:hypothetical protein